MGSQPSPKPRRRLRQQQTAPPDGYLSPLLEESDTYRQHTRRDITLRHVQRVTKQAALEGRRRFWDSNDASIYAAQTAVDHWEQAYTGLRGLMVASAKSVKGIYGAAKAGASGLEHGLMAPLRDWVLMPAFWGVEQSYHGTVGFLQSPQAAHIAGASLEVVKKVPYVGENVLAPALVMSVDCAKTAWHVAQYPIPSRVAVRDSVDRTLTGTKWVLTTLGREIYFYAKLVDSSITRTLSHTQWKVLGSGPYSTLEISDKREVIDHLCERYFSIESQVGRYELTAHIRAHNRQLYHDLVLTGLLRERGGALTHDDEWLSSSPSYQRFDTPFLLSKSDYPDRSQATREKRIIPLWFRLPYQHGRKSTKDAHWVLTSDQSRLEERYLSMFSDTSQTYQGAMDKVGRGDCNVSSTTPESISIEDSHPQDMPIPNSDKSKIYPTIAQWYVPDLKRDVLIDQKRHAVSFRPCCPRCQVLHSKIIIPPLARKRFGSLCDNCKSEEAFVSSFASDNLFSPPAVSMVMRPTLWRFHGPGEEVRRATWLLDTKKGLQPYSEESAAVLEDAYLFLKFHFSKLGRTDNDLIDGELLTVQVSSPDGSEQQLVQFRSLTQVTAIQKTLGGAISLFKRRVYRGVDTVESIPKPDPRVSKKDTSKNQVKLRPEEQSECLLVPDLPTTGKDSMKAKAEADSDQPVEETKVSNQSSGASVTKHGVSADRNSAAALAVRASRVWGVNWQEKIQQGGDGNNIGHLILIVHGIGEQNVALGSIVDCCGFLRRNHEEIQDTFLSDKTGFSKNGPRGRVEYIPIEWHEAFVLQSKRHPWADLNSRRRNSPRSSSPVASTMNDISLNTIPQMRAFANDTLLDVLFFMSPEHHDVIIDIVTNEMNLVVDKFRHLTGFNGDVSLIAHSLGSIIIWDLLANQNKNIATNEDDDYGESLDDCPEATSPPADAISRKMSSSAGEVAECSRDVPSDEADDARLRQLQLNTYPQLSFDVKNTFMLGSPIAVFLMIRKQDKPLSEEFNLPGCRHIYNIFHPYDPVAYRIEPLIDSRNADIEPRIIAHWKGGFRVHYQTKLLWKTIVDTTWNIQQHAVDEFEARMAGLGLLNNSSTSGGDSDSILEDGYSDDIDASVENDDALIYVKCGNLNAGRRIDYMLQEKEIENANEYVAALAAHSSYWSEKDLCLFVARQILRSSCYRNTATTTTITGNDNDSCDPSAAAVASEDEEDIKEEEEPPNTIDHSTTRN